MNYLTLEVGIDHGRVMAKGLESLPEKASGLLTIFQVDRQDHGSISPIQALETLQKQLAMDPVTADEWMASVGEARR